MTQRRRSVDGSALVLTIGLHGVLLALLLLSRAAPLPVLAERSLSVFDVALPPIPPPIEPPPSPPAPRTPGGSPPPPAPAALPAMEATAQPLAPPQPPVAPAVSPFADALGLETLPGTGAGHSTGAGAGTGAGSGAGEDSTRYARAEWIRRPSDAEVRPFLTWRMRKDRVGGRVVLGCIVPKPGRPKRCWVLSEAPAGVGLGRAVVAMSTLFRIRPVHRDDQPLDVPVMVPVTIVATGGAVPKAP